MLYHPNNYWKCLGKKSPLPSKNKLFLQNYSAENALLQKQCFYWRGIPHKNYFAEISTSHVVFFQSRNDDLWKSPRPVYVHICKSALASFPWWSSGRESTCPHRGHGFDPRSRKITYDTRREPLSPCTTTTEADAPWVHAPHQERVCTQRRRLGTVKNKDDKTTLVFKSSLHCPVLTIFLAGF